MFRKRTEPKSEISTSQQEAPSIFQLLRMRLYQPDSVLAERLPNGVPELAAYCKTLVWVGAEYFGRLGRDFGPMGVLIVVGIRPERRVKLWSDQVEGDIPPDVWEVFVDLLEGAGVSIRPMVMAPVALALECSLGPGPTGQFPMGPQEWQEAVADLDHPVEVPDELFEIVFQE